MILQRFASTPARLLPSSSHCTPHCRSATSADIQFVYVATCSLWMIYLFTCLWMTVVPLQRVTTYTLKWDDPYRSKHRLTIVGQNLRSVYCYFDYLTLCRRRLHLDRMSRESGQSCTTTRRLSLPQRTRQLNQDDGVCERRDV